MRERGTKLPAIQWYTGDWKKDQAVAALTSASRGIWFELLNAMHEADRCGMLCGTPDQLARIARATPAEFAQALKEFQSTKVGDVTFRNSNVTIINRRMNREYNLRESNRIRKRRQRGKDECHDNVTSYSSSSSSDIKENEEKKNGTEAGRKPTPAEPEAQRIWEGRILPKLCEAIDEASFETWIKPIVPLRIHDSDAVLGSASTFCKNWVVNNYHEQIVDVLSAALQREMNIRYEIME